MSGCYLALEGVEGAGKSTVAKAVAARLRADGREVVEVREPGGTVLGEEIRRLLLHADEMAPWAEAMLFAAQRAQLVAEVVGPSLERGAWVVSDRSYYSSLAYQGDARGLGVDAVRMVNEYAVDGVIPDLVAVLDIDPDRGLARQGGVDRIGGLGPEFQRRVAAAYQRLAAVEPARVVIVPVDRGPDALAERIVELVEARCG